MDRWEYCELRYKTSGAVEIWYFKPDNIEIEKPKVNIQLPYFAKELRQLVARLGEDGWELITITPGDVTTWELKRRIQP